MLDFQTSRPTKLAMSRKRTRSRSEDNIYGTTRVQPLNMNFREAALYSDDPLAQKILQECDYSIKITHEMARAGKAPRPIRVFADGAFDVFHSGHARALMQAKNAYPNIYLIVGVCSDATLNKMKGKTVLNEEERYDAVTHCRYVDEVLRDCPWGFTDEFIYDLKIDFLAHDDIPYPGPNMNDLYGPWKERDMFIATCRKEGISTTDVVARIVRDYDVYARRNLARGYSAKDMNISFFQEKKFRVEIGMENFKDKINEMKNDLIQKWEELSNHCIAGFLNKFLITEREDMIEDSIKETLQETENIGNGFDS